MKIYRFNKKELTFRKVSFFRYFLMVNLTLVFLTTIVNFYFFNQNYKSINEEIISIIINKNEINDFNQEKLIKYLKTLNIKYPHIVIAQAMLETNNFNSRIFIENNNLFGMKVATIRPTTNKGEQHGHAFYENWRESVLDYALYSATYLKNIKTEDEYFNYLSQYYAEDTNYIIKLKKIIDVKKLKKH